MQTEMTMKEARYASYLLRLWETSADGEVVWRASLEHPHTGERLGFATLERLFAFLQDQCSGVGEHDPASKHVP
ncbi:MAG TPA: hypothetical protein VF707_11615 [Ardenticatenaceae bacterium]